jgi:hypothetical protein
LCKTAITDNRRPSTNVRRERPTTYDLRQTRLWAIGSWGWLWELALRVGYGVGSAWAGSSKLIPGVGSATWLWELALARWLLGLALGVGARDWLGMGWLWGVGYKLWLCEFALGLASIKLGWLALRVGYGDGSRVNANWVGSGKLARCICSGSWLWAIGSSGWAFGFGSGS